MDIAGAKALKERLGDKAKVETAVLIVQRWILARRKTSPLPVVI